jgi:hypothetical protein
MSHAMSAPGHLGRRAARRVVAGPVPAALLFSTTTGVTLSYGARNESSLVQYVQEQPSMRGA